MQFFECHIDSSDIAEEVCWHNLTVADELRLWDLVSFAAQGWLIINPKKNFCDLEKEFRKRKMNTYLIASNKSLENTKIKLRNDPDSSGYQYECIFSCRFPDMALEEIKQYWPDYKTNFEMLKQAGTIIISNCVDCMISANPHEKITKIPTKMQILANRLATNNCKIFIA